MKPFKDVAPDDIAVYARVITRRGATRIVRSAFEYAQAHGYPSVTLVEKPNVLRETSGLMVEAARAVAREFPSIPLWETNIDAQVMWLLKNPRDYGVLVLVNGYAVFIGSLVAF